MVSIDPKRVYVSDPSLAPTGKTVVKLRDNLKNNNDSTIGSGSIECGPGGERYCWWQTTVKGGREVRDIDAVQLAKACEDLGAGEIVLIWMDNVKDMIYHSSQLYKMLLQYL